MSTNPSNHHYRWIHGLFRRGLLLGLIGCLTLTVFCWETKSFGWELFAAETASPPAAKVQKPEERQATPVIAQTVSTSEIHRQIMTSGDILPMLGVDLHPKTGGQIVRFDVREGSRVAQGSLLAEIDHRIQDAQLEQAKAALTVAHAAVDMQEVMVKTAKAGLTAARAQADAVRAQVKNLAVSRDRLDKLFKEGAISGQQLDDVTAQRDAAEAQLVAATSNIHQAEDAIQSNQMTLKMKEAQLIQAQANLHTAEVQLEDAFIRAPFAGVITHRHTDPGAMANAGQPLLRLEQMNPVKIVGTLVEKNLLLLDPGRTEARVRVDTLDREFTGTVARIYPAIDSKTRTGQFEIVLDNPDLTLRSGMFTHIQLFLETAQGAVVIPRDALLSHNGELAAIRIDSGGLAEKVPVRTGIIQDDRIEILDGLKAGDRIVTQGLEFIRIGSPVKAIIQDGRQ